LLSPPHMQLREWPPNSGLNLTGCSSGSVMVRCRSPFGSGSRLASDDAAVV
jgi:hypothetical protein